MVIRFLHGTVLVKQKLALVLSLLLFFAACGADPELIGVDNPDVPARSVSDASIQRILIATTRQPSAEEGVFYSGQRSQTLNYASVDVSIPPNHRVGMIERPKKLPPNPATEFAVVNPVSLATDQAFISAVNRALLEWPKGKRNVMLFVHGYNTTTSDAVLRLAQMVEDSGFEGVPILFSWASAAKTTQYVYDLNSALISREALPKLGTLLRKTKAEGFDIFAHSMGGLVTMEGLVASEQRGLLNKRGDIDKVILASPDVDLDLFRTQLKQLDNKVEIFVLLSEDDNALRFSRLIAGGVPRVGAAATEDLTELGAIIIDLTDVETEGTLNHSKFASSPEVVQLIGRGLNRTGDIGNRTPGAGLAGLIVGAPIRILFD